MDRQEQTRILASHTDDELKQLRDQELSTAAASFAAWWTEHHLFGEPAPDEPEPSPPTNGDPS